MSEQRRWEAAQARIARELPASQEEDEDISMMGSSNLEGGSQHFSLHVSVFNHSSGAEIIDDPMSEENAELEALLSLLESPDPVNKGDSAPAHSIASLSSGSEDEEYDRLFLDLVNQECNSQDHGTSGAELGTMDTSSG